MLLWQICCDLRKNKDQLTYIPSSMDDMHQKRENKTSSIKIGGGWLASSLARYGIVFR